MMDYNSKFEHVVVGRGGCISNLYKFFVFYFMLNLLIIRMNLKKLLKLEWFELIITNYNVDQPTKFLYNTPLHTTPR